MVICVDGFLFVDDIVAQAHFKNTLHATNEIIQKIVDVNDKKRFEIVTNENGKKKIRALQGHSIKVTFYELKLNYVNKKFAAQDFTTCNFYE